MTVEVETYDLLVANLEAASRALAAGDTAALRALAEQEARLVDVLKAIWGQRGD